MCPLKTCWSFESPGIALDQTGRFFPTANEGDTRNATASAGLRGGRAVSIFDCDTGRSWAKPATARRCGGAGALLLAGYSSGYPDDRSNRGGSEPEALDLTHYRGLTLVAVSLERANAVALIDVSDPTDPRVISIAPVDVGPEGIKFFRFANRLFLAVANEVSGTLTILEVML